MLITWVTPCILLAFFLIISISSCNVFKTKTQRHTDSTALHKITITDSAGNTAVAVKKEETKSTEENEWWRIIQLFAGKKDTTINNTNLYPSTIIYEGGKQKKEESAMRYDSAFLAQFARFFFQKIDSTNARIDEVNKQKKSSAITIWHILGACIGTVMLFLIISKIKISVR